MSRYDKALTGSEMDIILPLDADESIESESTTVDAPAIAAVELARRAAKQLGACDPLVAATWTLVRKLR